MPDRPGHFHRHRFPAEVISYAVWLYYRFPLSRRDVEEFLSEHGIPVALSHSGRRVGVGARLTR
jgi:transposase-like protein